jgi:hypothetical protein
MRAEATVVSAPCGPANRIAVASEQLIRLALEPVDALVEPLEVRRQPPHAARGDRLGDHLLAEGAAGRARRLDRRRAVRASDDFRCTPGV